jgi:hypothetical protein
VPGVDCVLGVVAGEFHSIAIDRGHPFDDPAILAWLARATELAHAGGDAS